MANVRCTCVFFVLSFFVLKKCDALINITDELCYSECGSRVDLEENGLDLICNNECKITKCFIGCMAWKSGIMSSCEIACAERLQENKILNNYCVFGCSIAASLYVAELKKSLGTPLPPYLVAVTSKSVKIRWMPTSFKDISYLVQYRREALHYTDWEYSSSELLLVNELTVKELRPYTNYQFRVAWIFLKNVTLVFSRESKVIATLPSGVPTSPAITCITAVGPTMVSINWESPVFPNGPIHSYVLTIKEYSTGSVTIKDISDISEGLHKHFMFNNLTPSTTYIIAVAARNNAGEGPADVKNVSTPGKNELSDIQQPSASLLFAADQNVLKQGTRILDKANIIYQNDNSEVLITGLAIHIKKNYLFLSDAHGHVKRMEIPITGAFQRNSKVIFKEKNDTRYPTLLSVDYMNDLLYMLQDSQISRCDLNGESRRIVLTELKMCQITDLHVDSFNGFLFWSVYENNAGGIYRIDLADLESRPKTLKSAKKIIHARLIMSFLVDFKNFRLFFPLSEENTIISATLDGSEKVNIRDNSQSSQFTSVKSLTFHENRFYWTNGFEIFGEEYLKAEDKFYEFSFPVRSGRLSSLTIHHPFTQPEPIPLNEVEGVQALFSDNKAMLSWLMPRSLGGKGKGAWQKWLYEIHLIDILSNRTVIERNLMKNNHIVENLSPNVSYSIKIRACSSAGKGPWSMKFLGRTLKLDNYPHYPLIFMSDQRHLVKSNIIGQVSENISLKLNYAPESRIYITDIKWYNRKLVLLTSSSVYIYDIHTKYFENFINVADVRCIAIDWFAPKIYYSNAVQISRSCFDGSQPEALPISTVAIQLTIDSPAGYLYWATSHSIECSRLNGEDHLLYMKHELFSGKYVMGLTLDFDSHKLYYLVKSNEGSHMYRSSLANVYAATGSNLSVEYIGALPEGEIKGPISYFDKRLLWIHKRKGAFITDMSGENIATIRGVGMSEVVETLAVIDPSLQPFPGDFDYHSLKVIPEAIDRNSMEISGTWDSFNITFGAVEGINYGAVFYDIKVHDGHKILASVTKTPIFTYPTTEKLKPFSTLNLSIRAYTYYASSHQTILSFKSPMSTPSKPENPRVFASKNSSVFFNNENFDVLFRWCPPLIPNGIVEAYEIMYGQNTNSITEVHTEVTGGNTHEFHVGKLVENRTYNFKVRARTQAGFGDYSNAVEISDEKPVPLLLSAEIGSIKLIDVDTHGEKELLGNKVMKPSAIAYLADESRVFWSEEDGSLMSATLDGKNTTLLARHSSSPVKTLSVDWIAKKLYFVEINELTIHSSVYSLDFTLHSFPKLVFEYPGIIVSLEIEPYTSSLVFVATKDFLLFQLIISNAEGQCMNTFFSESKKVSYDLKHNTCGKKIDNEDFECNCFFNASVSTAIAITYMDRSEPNVLWADEKSGHIWITDFNGCKCEAIINATGLTSHGLPPSSLTIDKTMVYWTNTSMEMLFMKKRPKSIWNNSLYKSQIKSNEDCRANYIFSKSVQGIRAIRAIGNSLQPYPDQHCLQLLPYKETAKLLSRSSSDLKLYVPPPKTYDNCIGISIPTIVYIIQYTPVLEKKEETFFFSCPGSKTTDFYCEIETTNNTFALHQLKPFTNYTIRVAVKNYFNRRKDTFGPEVTYSTKEGAPTAPRNVSAIAITPFRIDVYWQSPLFHNGRPIEYEVRWRIGSKISGTRSIYVGLHGAEVDGNMFVMSIASSSPGKRHYVTVRAYSSAAGMHNDSKEITVTTYEAPGNMTLKDSTFNFMCLLWKSPDDNSILMHSVEYSELNRFQWSKAVNSDSTAPGKLYEIPVHNLKSKTLYSFRLLLTYGMKNVTIKYPKNPFIFGTLGRPPSPPGEPKIKHVMKNVYQIYWSEKDAAENDGTVYELEKIEKKSSDARGNWSTIYNGSNTDFYITEYSSEKDVSYYFRVRAINEFGFSNFTYSNNSFFLQEIGAIINMEEERFGIILTVSSVALLIILAFIASIYFFYKRKGNEKKKFHGIDTHNQVSSELELATLQELPQNANFIHETNALYNLRNLPLEEDLSALPLSRVHRSQIVLTKFLGSGAFGEVFEGSCHTYTNNTHELIQTHSPLRIAIKTLRKSSTEHEKEEFFKEAKLMSNFKHDHILQLLGVCFDNDPNFIILELMEGGDLLSFLRNNRPSLFEGGTLSLHDLLGICVDVAKGCKYLEDMHFVHRDLAARNCLVSSEKERGRVVKIGDFGLARDIYKSDYYRKEGEGLLPVRWMSPESLIYGIFSNKTDVWAFGVLLWEIMTLGQQPYPARSNVEVLNFVRAGGKLEMSEECPEDLNKVMTLCWSYNPDSRPSFGFCLNYLQDLEKKYTSAIPVWEFPINQNQIYLNDSIHGFQNLGYTGDDQFERRRSPEIRNVSPTADGYITAGADAWSGHFKTFEGYEDTFSTRSDPGMSSTVRSCVLTVKRSTSLTYKYCPNFGYESVLQFHATTSHRNKFGLRNCDHKYLELLNDNEDLDGYEIPRKRNGFSTKTISLKHCLNIPTVKSYGTGEDKSLPSPVCNKVYPCFGHQIISSNRNPVCTNAKQEHLYCSYHTKLSINTLLNETKQTTNLQNVSEICKAFSPKKLCGEDKLYFDTDSLSSSLSSS